MHPYYSGHGITLYCGDALELLPQLPARQFDAIVADPPYSSGGAFRGDRMSSTTAKYVRSDSKRSKSVVGFTGDNRDQRSFLAWSTLWLNAARRTAKDGAALCLFTDWRQLPTTTDAVQCGGYVWRGIAVWRKVGPRPTMGRFAAGAEYIVWGSKGLMPTKRGVGVLPGVFEHASVRGAVARSHTTPKPVPLLRDLVAICPAGGDVLDPFAGTGSTLIAAMATGRTAVGIEIDEAHCASIVKNIGAYMSGQAPPTHRVFSVR